MKKILVVGSINMDLVTRTEKIPKIGETVLGKDFRQIPGGKGANQAVAASRLGAEVSMIGMVGSDSFGENLIQVLGKDGIDISGIGITSRAPTGVASITVDDNGDNSIIVVSGANFELGKKEIDANRKLYEESEIVVHQLETPLEVVGYSLELSKFLGKVTVLNPAPARYLSEEVIKNVDYLIPNESELEILTGIEIEGKEDILRAGKLLIGKGVKNLILTLGSEGSLYMCGEEVKEFSAFKVRAVDTTAAGDSFIGGLVASISKGSTVEEAIGFAGKSGAIAVTREGAQSSLPTKVEVENFEEEL